LTELVKRLADEPERALPHVRALVGLSPYEESHRGTLIRLLNAARQFGEAEEQFQLGLRILKEAAIPSSGARAAAKRGRDACVPSGASQRCRFSEQPSLTVIATELQQRFAFDFSLYPFRNHIQLE